ncbi:MAG: ATP-binding cassette domain-containing protein [Actinomyces sp.]|uniref:ABC transporter ATP-binding protein n=1 Tax=Actinomyces sp. TaxID=29317 RepID=UPI0026DAFC6F|nr:ATP-binding cassette domain-containing protein [Actinomyces sp.]MDO4243141.1 ATP-binding cassette domain-containing protein [Actinomyces sp.]
MSTSQQPAPSSVVPGLALNNISIRMGGRQILSELSLSARPGRVYGLLGPNGAGKSTTFNIALGLLRPDTGGVEVLGSPLTRASLSHVGASVNGPALYPQLSAEANLRIHCHLTGTSKQVIEPLLEHVGLSDVGGKRVRAFSTGMRMRLALAQALLGDPEILILDEPGNGLDPQGVIELRGMLRGLAAQGRTVVVSSHILGEMARTCDDIGVLVGGRMAFEGPLEELADSEDLEAAFLEIVTGQGARS